MFARLFYEVTSQILNLRYGAWPKITWSDQSWVDPMSKYQTGSI